MLFHSAEIRTAPLIVRTARLNTHHAYKNRQRAFLNTHRVLKRAFLEIKPVCPLSLTTSATSLPNK